MASRAERWGALRAASLVLVASGCHSACAAKVDDRLPVPCSGDTPVTISQCVDRDRYVAALESAAVLERTPGSPGWQAVQDLCANRFAELGFEVERMTYPTGEGVNVIGRLPGTVVPHEEVVVSAHYDAIADDCQAADDNASGVAGVLEVASALSQLRYARTLIVACWDDHEGGGVGGKLGSRAWFDRLQSEGRDLAMAFVFEMIGYRSTAIGSQDTRGLEAAFPAQYAQMKANDFRGDFVLFAVNDPAASLGAKLTDFAHQVGLPSLYIQLSDEQIGQDLFKDFLRSDHSWFWGAGYPAALITDTAGLRNDHYHCIEGPDSLDRLDPDFAVQVVRATTAAAAHALGIP